MATLFTPGGERRQEETAQFLQNLPSLAKTGARLAMGPAGIGGTVASTAKAIAGDSAVQNVLFGTPLLPAAAAQAITPAASTPSTGNLGNAPNPPATVADPLSATTMGGSIAPSAAALPTYQSAIDAGYQRQAAYGDMVAKQIQDYVATGGSADNRSYRAAQAIGALPQVYGPNNPAALTVQAGTAAQGVQSAERIAANQLGFERQKLAETPVPTGQRIDTSAGYGIPVTTYGVRTTPGGTPATAFAPAQPTAAPASGSVVEGSRSTSGGVPIIFRDGKWQRLGTAQ